jgi:glycosyltransferase involved in cell wall biosynthesis
MANRLDVDAIRPPQFFTAVAGATVGGLKRRRWVFELRDFWPESIVATGAMRKSAAITALERLEMALYRSADLIVPVTSALERAFDACLVPLRDSETFRSVIPSKIFEAATARRPILLGVEGESREMVERYGAGLVFQPESEAELVSAILRMRGEEGLYQSLQAGCERLARAYDRTALARQMLSLLEGLKR